MTVHPDFVDPYRMLPVPNAGGISRKRVEGKVCVWCRGALGDPVDLRPRLSVVDGQLVRWCPRGCRPCVGRVAADTYREHIRTCARCSHGEYCLESRAVRALARECR